MLNKSPRSEKLDLRLAPEAKRKIAAAARAKHCSVTDFVLRSAIDRADEVLADQRVFFLNDEQWRAFQAALDAPPREAARMRRLLNEPSIFETQQLKSR
jgi:uncharacterized protein (DUF1778 family)